MATKAASAASSEREERELNAAVNEAIARTEDEVFADAMGSEELDGEADTSLEDMGDGLEGDHVDDVEVEDEEAGEGDPEAEGETEEGEEDAEGQERAGAREEQPQGRYDRKQGFIPPEVLRDANARRRDTESERDELRAQLRDMQSRLDNVLLQTRTPAQQQQQTKQEPTPKPDMFAEPDKYEQWVLDQAEQRALAKLDERLSARDQRTQQEMEQRLNENLQTAAFGPRGYEFNVAYRDLTSLPKTPEAVALVRRLCAQPDPAAAILDWWEKDSNPDYIEHVRDQVRSAYVPPQARGASRGANGRGNGREQQQPQARHEVRMPGRNPVSLNGAVGGGSQRTANPEMQDGSEASVFSFGSRRSSG